MRKCPTTIQPRGHDSASPQARQKLGEMAFFDINKLIHKEDILKNHLYAIDGSKVQVRSAVHAESVAASVNISSKN